jgi:hypothetical protein
MQIGLVTVVAVLIGGLPVTTAYGQAQTFTDKFTLELGGQGAPLCGGEPIEFSGKMNLIFHTTISPDGEIEHSISHTNFQGATAVSASGERFVISDVTNQIAHTDEVGPGQFITVIHGTLVDKGQGINGVNTLFQLVIHIFVDENGEVTGEVIHTDTKCVG